MNEAMGNKHSFAETRRVRALVASNIFFLIFLFVLSPEPARAEPLISILYTGDSLGLYKPCPT